MCMSKGKRKKNLFVADQLVKGGGGDFYFWKREKDAELSGTKRYVKIFCDIFAVSDKNLSRYFRKILKLFL